MKIIVFHMNQLGDLLFSLPILSSLTATPENQVYCVVRPGFKKLLETTSLPIKVFIRPQTNNIFSKLQLISEIKQEKIDLAIILSESIESRLIAYWSKIPKRVGFARTIADFLLTDKIKQYLVPSIMNNLNLLKHLGITPTKTDYRNIIKVSESDKTETRRLLADYGIQETDSIVVISPGTSERRKEKSWNETKLAHVIRETKSDKPTKWILVGNSDDMPTAELISKFTRVSVVNLTGLTDLVDLTEILSCADVVLSVDNGVMHLASAMGKPVVALFGPTNPELIGPQGEGHIIIKKNTMEDIKFNEVISAIESILQKK